MSNVVNSSRTFPLAPLAAEMSDGGRELARSQRHGGEIVSISDVRRRPRSGRLVRETERAKASHRNPRLAFAPSVSRNPRGFAAPPDVQRQERLTVAND